MSLNTEYYIYKLRFSIDKDAPPNYMERWSEFKNKCENGENRYIVEHVKELCLLQVNKNLPYLDRYEGGMGGDDNKLNKQIRFRKGFMWSKIPSQYDNDIVMDEICNTETEKWTYEEMDDLLSAFIKVSEYYVNYEGCGCMRGCIEMTPQDIYRY
jgi:hypothetical protein